MIKLSGKDVTFGKNTVSLSGERLITKTGIRLSTLSGKRVTYPTWNGHRFPPPRVNSVLYYPGYPAQGSTIKDFSGNGYDGTITGATWTRNGQGIWELDFNSATPDYVELLNSTQLNYTTGDFSMLAWIEADVLTSTRIIFLRGLADTDGYSFFIDSDQKLVIATYQGGASQFSKSAAATIAINTRYLVGFSRTGTSIIPYINGEDASDIVGTHTNPLTSARTAKIGIWDDKATLMFDGGIGLVRSESRSISAAEHKSIFRNERGLFGV